MTHKQRFQLDRQSQRHGDVLLGGSPIKLFRLTAVGGRVIDRISTGVAVPQSVLTEALLDAGAIHPVPASAPYSEADVTVVVPTLGGASQAPPGAIVVDDGSRPPVAEATIRLAENHGPAVARNHGLAEVSTPLVAFVDDDVTLPDNWLAPLLVHFSDPRVGLVAPRVTTPPARSALGRYEAHHSPLDLGVRPARIRAGTRVSYVPAAALVCRVDAIRAIGGFDSELRFGEDVDLVWRLDAAGWRCRYEPRSTVSHRARANASGWFRQRVAYGSSAAPLARRHPGALAPLRTNAWSVAAWLAATAGRPAAAAGLGLSSAAMFARSLPSLPRRAAFDLARRGHVEAGQQIASAIRRTWWPLLMLAAVRSRIARRVLVAAAVAARHPIGLADDVVYSIGVWKGMVAERTIAPIVPVISLGGVRSRPTVPHRRPSEPLPSPS